jgi:DNA-binding FrmR family transcriptional regulator
MTHTVREKRKLLARVRRVRGQIDAIERALEGEAECERIMHLVAGVRGSVAGLMAELLADHVRMHFVGQQEAHERGEAAEQLIEIVNSYLR